jgi:hypothetical protein
MRDGRAVIGVRPRNADRSSIVATLRAHGAHFINRFGAWSTEEVVAWRGASLQIPHLMQR